MTHELEPITTEVIDMQPGMILRDTYENFSEKKTWGVQIVAALCLLAVLGGGITHIAYQADRINNLLSQNKSQSKTIGALIAENQAANENARSLYDQLLELGAKPQGTNPQVYAPGLPGEAGRDGRDATDEQIDAGIARYCAVVGCTPLPSEIPGPEGAQGEPGRDGQPGPVGATGVTGAQGAPGVGIQGIACLESGDWRFTMTDSSALTVPGPCRVTLLPGNGNNGNN